jgi:hypothetical protein
MPVSGLFRRVAVALFKVSRWRTATRHVSSVRCGAMTVESSGDPSEVVRCPLLRLARPKEIAAFACMGRSRYATTHQEHSVKVRRKNSQEALLHGMCRSEHAR